MSYKAITIYTPPSAAAHIAAEDDAFIYNALAGGRSGILGSLTCTVVNDTTVRLSGGGGAINKGYVLYVPNGSSHSLTVSTGTQSLKRHDLVVAEFIRGGGSTADIHRFRIITGTASSNPTDPALTTSNLLSTGSTNQIALFRLKLNGLTLESAEPVARNITSSSFLRLRGVSNNVAAEDGEITKVNLTQTGAVSSGNGLVLTDGAIKCLFSGTVEVTGSVYMQGTADADKYFGCYIMHNSTELTPGMRSANQGAAVSTPTETVNVSAGDTFTLCCRSNCDNGMCLGNNSATWLSVRYI